jgi:hypothetical protein
MIVRADDERMRPRPSFDATLLNFPLLSIRRTFPA